MTTRPDPSPAPAAPVLPARQQLLDDVLTGLGAVDRTLPCKWFYDAAGSELFERICDLPEYYLTRTELQILHDDAAAMAAAVGPAARVVEFGSGSARKTALLLAALATPLAWVPVDISRSALDGAAAATAVRFPRLRVQPVWADYTQRFALPSAPAGTRRTLCYFPGSTIGNFTAAEAEAFLRQVAGVCGPGGALLIGTDLVKDVAVLLPAYDDAAGVTAAFNRNLLHRVNAELGADFVPDAFAHRAIWNGRDARIEMQLVSRGAQTVRVAGRAFAFRAGEVLTTEYSHKYTLPGFAALAARCGFRVAGVWTDPRAWFAVQLLVVA